jgi:hypothetical protein
VGDERNACRILVGKPEGKESLGRIWDRVVWTGLIGLRMGTSEGFF